MPTIYRVHFFNELGKYCSLTVMFERYSATGVENKWDDSLAINFTPVFHRTISVGREGAFGLGLLKVDYSLYDEVIISSYSSPAEMLALLKLKIIKRPYLLEVDGGVIKKDWYLKRMIKRFFIKGADLYFSSSDFTTKYLTFYGADREKVVKYHFSSLFDEDILKMPISTLKKNEIKEEFGFGNKNVVLAVGQFIYRKGFDILINAASRLPKECIVVFVGGEPTNEYIELVKELNLSNIKFVSKQNKQTLKKYYALADVFVLPTREDIWGLVINEAMGMALPVITTDMCVAGVELIVNERNGFIVEVNNEVALAQRITQLLNDEDIRGKMSLSSLECIKSYSIENMAKEHYEVFTDRFRKRHLTD